MRIVYRYALLLQVDGVCEHPDEVECIFLSNSLLALAWAFAELEFTASALLEHTFHDPERLT